MRLVCQYTIHSIQFQFRPGISISHSEFLDSDHHGGEIIFGENPLGLFTPLTQTSHSHTIRHSNNRKVK